MMATALALSLSSSFTKVGAIVAFAVLVGIAVMSLLFFSQARELKRLREWAEAEPERAAEREQRLSAAVALRIQRATAQMARPVESARPAQAGAQPPAAQNAPVAAAASAVGVATRVAQDAPALALLPAAPAIIATGKANPEPAAPAMAKQPEPVVDAQVPTAAPVEEPSEERVPVMAAAAAAEPAVGTLVEAPARAPSPPPPVPAPAGRSDSGAPPAPRRAAPSSRESAETPARRTPQRSPEGSQPPRRTGARRTRNGPPPGPPFLREERTPSRLPLLLVGVGVVAVVILLVVVFSSGGSSPSASKSNASLSSSLSSTVTQQSTSTSSTATHSREAPPATSPSETHVVVLNATETAGLAHRLSTNLQQGGYTLSQALAGKPAGHSTSVVQYAVGHRADARQVAQALSISQVAPLEAATAALSSGATVVVIAGADKSSVP